MDLARATVGRKEMRTLQSVNLFAVGRGAEIDKALSVQMAFNGGSVVEGFAKSFGLASR